MFRELKLEAKIVAGGNLSAGSLSPTVDLWCLLNSGWELSGKEHLSSPLLSKHIVSPERSSSRFSVCRAHTGFDLPCSEPS